MDKEIFALPLQYDYSGDFCVDKADAREELIEAGYANDYPVNGIDDFVDIFGEYGDDWMGYFERALDINCREDITHLRFVKDGNGSFRYTEHHLHCMDGDNHTVVRYMCPDWQEVMERVYGIHREERYNVEYSTDDGFTWEVAVPLEEPVPSPYDA